MDQEIITSDGEIIESLGSPSSMAVQLQKAEVDQLITTARAYPRSLKHVQTRIMSMATLDEESAEECIYALPRGGKPIKGPSIRFAEILKQSFGNCRAAARVVAVDRVEMYVEAEGVFHDLETNSSTTARVRRRISDKRGKVFNDDMIIVTGNAACSIAMRNAILAGVPKPLWRRAYETVQSTITGDVSTLTENREKAFKALAAFGVKPEQVFAALGREGVEDISVDDIGTLRGMYAALKNGEATVEEMFFGTVKPSSQHDKVADPLSDAPAETPTDGSQAAPEPSGDNAAAETQNAPAAKSDNQNTDERGPASEASSVADEVPSASSQEDGGEVSPPSASSPSSSLSAETRQHLMDFARKGFRTLGEDLDNAGKLSAIDDMIANYRDAIPESDWSKLSTIKVAIQAVLAGKRTVDQARSFVATDLLDCSPAEIGGAA